MHWADVKFGVLSLSLVIALVVLAVFWVVQQRTTIGKYAFAVGANERAARLAGVNVNLTKVLVFTICGVASAVAGIFLSAKLKSGIPTVGDPSPLWLSLPLPWVALPSPAAREASWEPSLVLPW